MGLHLVIVGGGASGALLAAHVLAGAPAARVTIVEARHMLGCGVAYSTTDPAHLLNTRVANMSAYPADPDHFLRWLRARPEGRGHDGQSFVSRGTYGAYLRDLTAAWSLPGGDGRLTCLRAACIRLEEGAATVTAHLGDGRHVTGDALVLATGHVQPQPDPRGLLRGPWEPAGGLDPEGRPEGRIVVVGAGLTMVDQALSFLDAGHRGEILAVSRRGQLPRAHKPTRPLAVDPAAVPLGAPLSQLTRWARGLAAQAVAQGGTWRDAVDGLRPQIRRIWTHLPEAERARFLRHAAALWEVHRHRMPPESHARIRAARASGQLVLLRGAFLRADSDHAGRPVAVLRGPGGEQSVPAARIIDCRGIRRDPAAHATPLFADLLARGRARIDPLGISLDVDPACRVVAADGSAGDRLRAIGPVSRAAFWEITAIPDIREQAQALAQDLLAL